MARKMNTLNFPREIGEHAGDANRRLMPQLSPYLVPLHSPRKIYPPRYRLEIAIEVKSDTEVPSTVEIIHTV
jgi:hypothetical protein